jgi:hypothetical protein
LGILEFQLAQLGLDAAHVADAAEPVQIIQVMARAIAAAARSPPLAAGAGARSGCSIHFRFQQRADALEQRVPARSAW